MRCFRAISLAIVLIAVWVGSTQSDEPPQYRAYPIHRLPGHADRKAAAEAERQAVESGFASPALDETAHAPTRRQPVISLGFAGMDFTDGGGSVPPDTIAATGKDHIVEVVNSTIAIYNRVNGAKLSETPLATFFSGINISDCIFDPVVAYDENAQRFYVGAIDLPDACPPTTLHNQAKLLYAVSDSDNPTEGFAEMHAIDIAETSRSGCPPSIAVGGDFTRTGWNADAHVFSFNMFDFPGTCFDHVAVFVIEKGNVLDQDAGTAPVVHHVDFNSPNFTLVAARMHASNPGDPMWLVEESPSGNNIRVVKLSGLTSTPTISSTDIPVSSYGSLANAPQKGGGFKMDTGDTSILQVEARGNRLVATHTVGIGGVAKARFYEFDISGTPSLTQQGTIDPGSGIYTYYPSIAIAANGDLGMTFMQSSTQEFVSMYVTGQLFGDPPGTMQTPMLAKAGERNYTAFDCGTDSDNSCRAGDYSGITVDPDVSDTFCAANEYATSDASENWGTWIACFTLQPDVVPHDLAVTALKASKTAKNGVPSAVTVTIQNRSPHVETIAPGDLGNGVDSGLVQLAFLPTDNDNETCGAPEVQLNNAKNAALFSAGSKVLAIGKTMKVNFLVTYNCASPISIKGDSTPNDFSLTATVHHEELAGSEADSHPADDMCPRGALGFDPNPAPKGTVDKGCGGKQGGPILVNVVP